MAKRKYFITKKMINFIIQKFGGNRRWKLREDISEYSCVVYMDKNSCMLCIDHMFKDKEGKFEYVLVSISDSTGIIRRKDRFDFVDTNKKVLEYTYSEEK